MVRPGEGLEITSSRIRRHELYRGGEDPGRVDRVLAKLVAARLVRLTEGETPGDAQVEVAHEALVRNWPTLVGWLEEERVALATRRRLEGRATEWVRLGQGSAGLLDEVELREAERWLESPEASYLGFDPVLPALVRVSRSILDRERQETEDDRQRKLELLGKLAEEQRQRAEIERLRVEEQRKTNSRLWRIAILGVVLAVVCICFLGTTLVAFTSDNGSGGRPSDFAFAIFLALLFMIPLLALALLLLAIRLLVFIRKH